MKSASLKVLNIDSSAIIAESGENQLDALNHVGSACVPPS